MPIERAIESILQDAIWRGEFNRLPGEGRPVNLDGYFNTPEDLRLAYSILKNADTLPEEAELLKEISALRDELAASLDGQRRQELGRAIEGRLLRYNLALEARKRGR
ncbi:MAG: DUF1992 domain-containing protein [Chloroflexi bacterium]|nr:DUF1992 domain-containing protein [Chloroflexota bacterium]